MKYDLRRLAILIRDKYRTYMPDVAQPKSTRRRKAYSFFNHLSVRAEARRIIWVRGVACVTHAIWPKRAAYFGLSLLIIKYPTRGNISRMFTCLLDLTIEYFIRVSGFDYGVHGLNVGRG